MLHSHHHLFEADVAEGWAREHFEGQSQVRVDFQRPHGKPNVQDGLRAALERRDRLLVLVATSALVIIMPTFVASINI